MPIRMDDDRKKSSGNDNYPGRNTNNPRTPGKGGGGLIGSLLPLLLKNPKLLILGVVAFFGYQYLMGGGCGDMSGGGGGGGITSLITDGLFSTGFDANPTKYDATEIYEPLADNKKNPLPEKVSLLEHAPKRLNQGRQGSCVGWASSYAARTIIQSQASGNDPNSLAFSPSYLYNQIALNENCQGAYLHTAMKYMKEGGVAPFNEYGYDENSCYFNADSRDKQVAQSYKINGFQRLTKGDNIKKVDYVAMKQHLAQGAPVVIGMMVGGSFMQGMMGQDVWIPKQSDYNQSGFGGHAMCVIGYDDYKYGNEGAFQIMNSWGPEWGKNGVGWVRYKDFEIFNKEAYGIYPMGDADKPQGTVNEISFGLYLTNQKDYVELKQNFSGVMASTSPLAKGKNGSRFKVEVTNSLPCYIYIFGAEQDNSSYVLFPYTSKHSPYCGITGTRVFPNDKSMYPDSEGEKDRIAVVVTNEPLDYDSFNSKLNNASGSSFKEKLDNALGADKKDISVQNTGKNLKFNTELTGSQKAGWVIELDKK